MGGKVLGGLTGSALGGAVLGPVGSALGGAFGIKNGGKLFPTQGDTTTTVNPWGPQQPYLIQGYQKSSDYLNSSAPTVAGFTPYQQQATSMMAQRANGSPLESAAEGNLAATANGNYLNAGNPYFQNMVNQAAQSIRPSIDSQFEGAGRYGSGSHAAAMDSALTNMAGSLAYQNYGNERQNQIQASAVAPSMQAMDYNNLNNLFQAGSLQQQQQQNELNAPLQKLQNYNALISGNVGSQTTTPYFKNPMGSVLGGAMAGGSIGGPWGAAIGGGLGLLGAM